MPRKKQTEDTVSTQPMPEQADTLNTAETPIPDDAAVLPDEPETIKPKRAPRKKANSEETPISAREAFYRLDFRSLDKDLSPDEQKEWNAIYASFRAGSVLTGHVAGVDSIKLGEERVTCLVVFDYRVKVLIPYSEMWAEKESEQKERVMQRFLGAEVDYIIREIDREGNCAVASRAQALLHRRKVIQRRLPEPGDLVDCRVLAVSTTRMLLEYEGYETTLSQNSISYGTILDLREDYRPGQTVKAVFKGFEDARIRLSVKEVNPHPFENVETRHPLHCRRLSRIMGKYAGGVFCSLEKGFTCLCLYSPGQKDCDFNLGDDVIIVVTKYDYNRKLVYGRIVSGW